jgi:hypothetical protein
MPLYAQATKVPVTQSRAEIERLLQKHKAKQYGTAVDYDQRKARVQFRLEDRTVQKLGRAERYERAERQKWRALLLVIKAKLESVENDIESFEEAFLAHIVMPGDQTVAEIVRPHIAASYKSGKLLMPAPANAEPPR